jgi:hypothetical protein
MLQINDIREFRIIKRAQDQSAFSDQRAVAGRTLGDLYQAIQADQGVPAFEKMNLISQLHGMAGGAGPQTSLSSLMYRGLGGMVGMLISRYFGMGMAGQAMSALGGFGLASSLAGHVDDNTPFRGWKSLS